MCGLSGAAGGLTYKDDKVVKTLLKWSEVRGDDATGIASVRRPHKAGDGVEVSVAKEIGEPYYLFQTKRFDRCFHGQNMVFIGHNRSKTVGENTRENAHPFLFDTIVGAHNGTIDWQNKNRMEGGVSYKTDSEAIFANIEHEGIEKTISKIEDSEAYALVWYDAKDNSINFIRNEKRPLIYVKANDGTCVYWASEYGMLAAALTREGIKTEGKYWEFTPNYWYKWVLPHEAKDKLGEPVRKKLENHKEVKKSYGYSNGWNGYGFTDYSTKKKDQKTTTTFLPKQEKADTASFTSDSLPEDDLENWEYGGMYVGWLPKAPKTEEKTIAIKDGGATERSITDKAIEAVKETLHEGAVTNLKKANNEVVRSVANGGVTTEVDTNTFLRAEALEHLKKGGLLPKDEPPLRKRFDGANLKVWRHMISGKWDYIRYNPSRNSWELYQRSDVHPLDMPFTMLDIKARHQFKHKGQPGQKVPYFRGWNKELIGMERFEKLMQEGCVSCSRVPEWGNDVTFVTPQHEFLCEYCSETPGMIKKFIDTNPNRKKVA